jgi:hypothetical protein
MAYEKFTGERRYAGRGLDFSHATSAQTPDDAKKLAGIGRAGLNEDGQSIVSFPKHAYVPAGAEVVDIRAVATIPAGSTGVVLWRFRPLDHNLQGSVVRFISYAIFNDGLNEADYSFLPTVQGYRVLKYHGNPMSTPPFRIGLGLAPDLSNNSLIPCQLVLQPQEELIWSVTNLSAVDTAMGVRMFGYVDLIQPRVTQRFGGG